MPRIHFKTLDFPRAKAKALKRHLADRKVFTPLSLCQAATATIYGYGSWAELKSSTCMTQTVGDMRPVSDGAAAIIEARFGITSDQASTIAADVAFGDIDRSQTSHDRSKAWYSVTHGFPVVIRCQAFRVDPTRGQRDRQRYDAQFVTHEDLPPFGEHLRQLETDLVQGEPDRLKLSLTGPSIPGDRPIETFDVLGPSQGAIVVAGRDGNLRDSTVAEIAQTYARSGKTLEYVGNRRFVDDQEPVDFTRAIRSCLRTACEVIVASDVDETSMKTIMSAARIGWLVVLSIDADILDVPDRLGAAGVMADLLSDRIPCLVVSPRPSGGLDVLSHVDSWRGGPRLSNAGYSHASPANGGSISEAV